MKVTPALLIASLALVRASSPAHAQNAPYVFVPESSIEHPWDLGLRAHTNHLILVPNGLGAMPDGGLGPGGGMTPAQIRSFYDMPSSGGSNVIAIVDAYNYPTALNDFNVFANQFGLPVETSTNVTASTNQVFQIVYGSGTKPANNASWNEEEALDIEWAHALAPSAKIVLVEAASTSYTDLFKAVNTASALSGVREVSMSWGGSEFSSETSYDSNFPQNNGVVYFSSSGDNGRGTEYPSASPNVVAAGGTSVATNSSGVFTGETGWSGSGGGPSRYESRPSYQSGISGIVGSKRGVPDISSDADPNTGVSVYDSTNYAGYVGWLVFGGTSVASPSLAGMANLGGHFYGSSTAELTEIYANLGTSNFRDITSGSNGYRCMVGWDFVTGVGSPQGTGGF